MTILANLKTVQEDIKYKLEILENYSMDGKTCNSFLSKYIGKSSCEKNELEKDQRASSTAFQTIFSLTSRNTLNAGNTVYQRAQLLSESDPDDEFVQSLVLLDAKIKECESIFNIFKGGIVELLHTFSEPILQNNSMIGIRDLTECHCCYNMQRNPRQAFTKSLAEKVQKYFSGQQQISIASIGAGGCFHELTIHASMAKEGYKVQWIMVDPCISERTISRFKMIANWITPDTNIEGVSKKADQFFDDLKDKSKEWPDVFLFIDLDVELNSKIDFFGSKMKHSCLFGTQYKGIPPIFTRYPAGY